MRIGLLIIAIICLQLTGPQPLLAADNYTYYGTEDNAPILPRAIQNIEISGLKKTQPRTVLRELPFSVGDTWQESDKATGERRLRNTGLFAEAIITHQTGTAWYISGYATAGHCSCFPRHRAPT